MSRLLDPKEETTCLGRYELIAELASGGMATVYLGRRGGVGGFQRLVAIKRLHPHLAKDTEFVDMFIDEAKVAARIHHPNVVPIVDIETSAAGYFLVMEYIEGDTAARLLGRSASAGKRLPLGVTVRILLDTLAGLHAAHELRDDDDKLLEIVHRDVSPQNVLVGVDGTSRITDFGVARAASRLSTTRTGQLKGKLAYMAPEQAKGAKKGGVDRRADVFATGILLWEMTASKRLFKGDGDAETLNRVLYEPIPTLKSALPTAPTSLDEICARALDRDPDKRFATAAIMADDLERAAIEGGFLATHREVAAYIEATLGTDISQQRDAVRQWIGRSEPSKESQRPPRMELERQASRPSERTRVEGSKPSGAPPPDEINVSSVSSAAIAVPHPAPSNPITSGPPPEGDESAPRAASRPSRRRGTYTLALVALAVAAAVPMLLDVVRERRGGMGGQADVLPAAQAPVTSAAPAAVVPSVVSAIVPEPPRTADVGGDSGATGAAASESEGKRTPDTRPPTKLRRHRPARGATPPAGSVTGTPTAPPALGEGDKPAPAPDSPLPDDMTHNPYR